MRACEGCRRRKIKCDAATTNTWPCSACIRLKLHCVPPTINYDKDYTQGGQPFGLEKGPEHGDSSGSGDDEYPQLTAYQSTFMDGSQHGPRNASSSSFGDGLGTFGPMPDGVSCPDPTNAMVMPYNGYDDPSMGMPELPFSSGGVFATPPSHPVHLHRASESWHSEMSQPDLSGALGGLRIDEAGRAPYISHEKTLAQGPPIQEVDEAARRFGDTVPDFTARIPSEYMPAESQASEWIEAFFRDVHPYVPVLSKPLFFHQWHTNRDAISPLIIEAIFACAGSLSGGSPAEGAKWLALAGKHADSFMDVPRLSTIQAMLLILKARESSPKRGYYFRSWMTVVTLVAMAKDLGLDEHFDLHQAGESCESSYEECVVKTRIWQTLFVVELMIGAPQGRTDMAVMPDTVDLSVPRFQTGVDENEWRVSRDWIYMARIIRNVRRMNDTYAKVKKKPKNDWRCDPQFVSLNPSFNAWLLDLPPDLQVSYPPDGSAPWLPSHVVGNLHSYYELSIIMLHRPQLASSDSFALDGAWKHQMMLCYTSAKKLCRLQEAILSNFGLPGLTCMQRGIGFTVYAVLTCTVAITSPDPELNIDAKDFFTRHMRILEQCTRSWPMPEMQLQIDALREAFSADISKPFVLRSTFPYNSPPPMASAHTTPPHALNQPHGLGRQHSFDHSQMRYVEHPISPPMSAGVVDSRRDSNIGRPLVTLAPGPSPHSAPHHAMGNGMVDTSTWNPSTIFEQWNTAFGQPSAQSAIHAPSALRVPAVPPPALQSQSSHESLDLDIPSQTNTTGTATPTQDIMQNAFQSIPSVTTTQVSPTHHHHHLQSQSQRSHSLSSHAGQMGGYTGVTASSVPAATAAASLTPTFVSPRMWQNSVASVYEAGLKRGWDGGGGEGDVKRSR
ncbi:MAG: hypothetical protein M1817_005082 [Caeruleum heppii]|nr:MAG: hypothetical protein M1817_005082 [Caeruleum heppii]